MVPLTGPGPRGNASPGPAGPAVGPSTRPSVIVPRPRERETLSFDGSLVVEWYSPSVGIGPGPPEDRLTPRGPETVSRRR